MIEHTYNLMRAHESVHDCEMASAAKPRTPGGCWRLRQCWRYFMIRFSRAGNVFMDILVIGLLGACGGPADTPTPVATPTTQATEQPTVAEQPTPTTQTQGGQATPQAQATGTHAQGGTGISVEGSNDLLVFAASSLKDVFGSMTDVLATKGVGKVSY